MHPGRPGGRSLAERAADSGVEGAGARAAGAEARSAREGRHCWVHSPPGVTGACPGLLVEWRQRNGRWEGRVAYSVAGPHGPTLVEAWLPAAQLQPR